MTLGQRLRIEGALAIMAVCVRMQALSIASYTAWANLYCSCGAAIMRALPPQAIAPVEKPKPGIKGIVGGRDAA